MAIITARFDGRCGSCGGSIRAGEKVNWEKGRAATHVGCNGITESIRSQNNKTDFDSAQAVFVAFNVHIVAELEEALQQPAKEGFAPSKYQQGVFDFVRTGRGNAAINAVAGSGKTTTGVQVGRLLGIQMAVKTCHSIGYGCVTAHLGRCTVDKTNLKYKDLAEQHGNRLAIDLLRAFNRRSIEMIKNKQDGELPAEPPDNDKIAAILVKLVHFTMVTLTEPLDQQAFDQMVTLYDLDVPPDYSIQFALAVASILNQGAEKGEREHDITYDEMIYLPARWNLQPRKFQWVLVDEAQDLSQAQLSLVMKLKDPRGGRMLFFGDPRQSCYGFTGANTDSFDQIRIQAECQDLPLSICYRCPASHVALAQQIVPQIEPRLGAPEGTVESIKEDALPDVIQQEDLVLCRLTAPLIGMCIRMIAKKLPARVKGRDIAPNLTSMIKEIAKQPGFRYEDFEDHLGRWQQDRIARLARKKGTEGQIESLNDRCQGLSTCFQNYTECKTIFSLIAEIEALFLEDKEGDKRKASITLCTVHRAKGLEANRVFILKPHKMPLCWPRQQEWEAKQEQNIKYVSITRSKDYLCFVEE